MLVQFQRRCNQYNGGEIAGFPEVEALRLIEHGYCTAVIEQPVVKEEKPRETPSLSVAVPVRGTQRRR